uniref:NAD-specific glutamate dehydrogenase n=1 Tax=Anopheles atroparvus TaxID=41427 RepID=A0AAG5CTL2_ANOAO
MLLLVCPRFSQYLPLPSSSGCFALLGGGCAIPPLDLLVDRLLHLGLVVVRNARAQFVLRAELVLQAVRVALELVARLDALLQLLVVVGEPLGVLDHALDVVRRQAVLVVGDDDLLPVAGALVLGRHLQNTVGVDLKRHLDLGDATGRRRDASEVELAEQMVVLGHRPLALVHLDRDGVLVVRGGREDLRLLRRDDGVARDQLRHHATNRLDAHRERVNVEQHDRVRVLLARQHSGLHGRTVRDGLVRVDATRRLLAVEELLHQLLHLRDTGRAAHQHDLVDVLLVHVRVLQHLLHGLHRRAEQVHVELLELGARQRLAEVVALEERLDLDAHLVAGRQGPLRLLHLATQLLHRPVVLADVLALLLLVQLDEVVHDALIEVLTAQMRVAVGGHHLEHTVIDGQQRHVEGSTAQIEHQYVLLAVLLVQTVRDGGRRRLVDDAHDVQAGDHSRVLGRLTLGVVEVGRHGHDGVRHLLAQVRLGRFLHLAQHHGGDFLRREHLIALARRDTDVRFRVLFDHLERQQLDVVLHRMVGELAPDQTLRVEHRVLRVGRQLVLGGVTDQTLAVGRERHVGGCDAVSLVVGDDLHAAIFVDAHARVRRAQIDTDHRFHCCNCYRDKRGKMRKKN